MKIRVLLGLLVFVVAGAASCPKTQANTEACSDACTNLANLLREERARQNQESLKELDAESPEGQTNINDCAARCDREANEAHVLCLEKATTLKTWMACDDGSKDWL